MMLRKHDMLRLRAWSVVWSFSGVAFAAFGAHERAVEGISVGAHVAATFSFWAGVALVGVGVVIFLVSRFVRVKEDAKPEARKGATRRRHRK